MDSLTPGSVEGFFDFMKERHQIYLRREAGQPAPWTDDPWLQQYKFCNVYRELDKGTVWVARNVREPLFREPGLLVANVALARLYNWIPTLQRLGLPIEQWNTDKRASAEIQLEYEMRLGTKVFTDAYLIRSVSGRPKI